MVISSSTKKESIKLSLSYNWIEPDIVLCCKFDNTGTNLLYAGYKGSVFVKNVRKSKDS